MSKVPLIALCLLLSTTFLITGCQSIGQIKGMSDGQQVLFDYEQGFLDNNGVISITMPDGEYFSGKFVQETSSTSTSKDDWLLGEPSNDDTTSTTISSQTQAVLIGNKGNSMKCQFQLSNPDYGIDGGGIGTCQISNGKEISLTF